MQTIREVVSDIINELNAYRLDDRISYRYIKNRIFDAAAIFIKQDAESRKLYNLTDLWSPPKCYLLESAPPTGCVSCKTIKRTQESIGKSYQTGFGNTIKVFNSDMSGEYMPTSASGYSSIANRPFKPKVGYYWLSDNKIYIPDNDTVDQVIIIGMFKEGVDLSSSDKDCKKPLDFVFSFPDYIISLAKTQVITDILAKFVQIPADERSNDNSNVK